MKRKVEKIVNYTLNILIVLFSIVLLITLYNSIQLKIFKNSYSNFFGYSVFEIQTNSMADEIFADDWIIVKITKNVKVGDVITFDENGKFLTHRIIEKYGETFVTKGDANNSKDEPIDKKQIVGSVFKILPKFGLIRKTVFDKEVLLALIGFLFIVSFLFKKDKKEIEENTEDTEVYSFHSNKKDEGYLSKLVVGEKREALTSEDNQVSVDHDDDSNELFSFYEEKKSRFNFRSNKKQTNEDEIRQTEVDDTFRKLEETVETEVVEEQDEDKVSDENTEVVEETINDETDENKETVDNEIELTEENTEIQVQETSTEEETVEEENLSIEEQIKLEEALHPDLSKIEIDLDDTELEIVNKQIEEPVVENITEEDVTVDVDTDESNDDEEHDSSIITVIMDDVEKPVEPVKKKKAVVTEDIYKSIDQTIDIGAILLEPIEQTSETQITVYEDEIKNTEKEIELYKNKIATINGEKDAIDKGIKDAHDKEIKDEQDRIAKEEFDRLEAKKLTHISLENLSKRHYKTKNIIDKIMQLKILKLETFINLLNNGLEQKPNEPTIREALENTYNKVLFYNYFEVEGNKKLEVELKAKAEKLVKSYKGSDKAFEEKVIKNLEFLVLAARLEMNNKKTTKEKNDYYKKELEKYSKGLDWSKEMIPYLIKEFKEIQKDHMESLEAILKELDTKTFNLEFNKVNKDILAVNLEHNVAFDKFYSDYVIDATYKSGVIKEDKMNVVIQLLMVTILKNMLIGEFDKEYLIYLPESLYAKKTKINTLMKSINDRFVIEHSIITMSYDTFIKNRKLLREFKKNGYKFGVYMDFESNIQDKHKKSFGLIDYIFIDPEQKDVVTKNIPNDYFERIILSDVTKLLEDYEVKGGE